jgi:hypothetical protein
MLSILLLKYKTFFRLEGLTTTTFQDLLQQPFNEGISILTIVMLTPSLNITS